MSVLDDTEIPGLLPTVSYLGWPPETAETVADIIMAKLNRAKRTSLDWENEARSLYQAYHPEEALAVYEQFFQIYSEQLDSHNWHYKGDILWALKRFEEALEAYEQAIQLNPYSTIPYDGKSFALWKLNRHEETLAVFEQIEQIVQIDTIYPIAYSDYFIGYSPRPDRRSYHCNWSNCSHWTPTAFWQNIQLDPLNVSTYIVKGISYYRQARNGIRLQNGYSIEDKLENCEQALASYVSAIQLNPEYALAYNCKGEMFYTLGGYWEELFPSDCEEVAYAAFEKAIQLNPNYTYAYNNKGKVLYALKRYEEALAAFDQAYKYGPQGNSYKRAGHARRLDDRRVPMNRFLYERTIQISPNYATINDNRGKALLALGRYEEALAAFEQALYMQSYDNRSADSLHSKGLVLYALKRYEEALAAYDWGIRVDANCASIYTDKGNTLFMLKHYEEALAVFEQALFIEPSDAYAYNGKALMLFNLKRYDEALAVYEQVIQMDPTFTPAYRGKEHVLKHIGREEEAQRFRKKTRPLGAIQPN
jgi:tetratricopeptide (TPR) repeat protein